ncbi:putative ribonuclease H-like domain-containing protein [Tanacetum coccineum]
MSMLEDHSSYIKVLESAQDTDGEVNPTHAYYNGSRTSQDIEDPSWSTSIKTRIQRRHLQHWKRVGCHFIMLYLYLLGTLPKAVNTTRPNLVVVNDVRENQGHQQKEDQGYVNSGCLRYMTGNKSYLSDFNEFDGGYVTIGGGAKRGKITGKRTFKTGKLDFEDVYFVKELQFNLFSVSQMCDKKNSVLFTDTRCFVMSSDFKLADESQVLLKVPRKNNMYSVDMKNIVPKESLTCLVVKATLGESMLWHRRLGHVFFKTINKLVKENLVRGLPSKSFENDQTCVACLKRKQHKASYLRGFFLASKDETSGILKNFITDVNTNNV